MRIAIFFGMIKEEKRERLKHVRSILFSLKAPPDEENKLLSRFLNMRKIEFQKETYRKESILLHIQ